MKLKRALVIGARGFIGRQLCASLIDAGYYVIALDILPEKYTAGNSSNIKHIVFDIVKANDFESLLDKVDVVFYLACSLLPHASNDVPVYDIESNLVPIVKLMEAIRNKKNKPRVIFSSSGGTVYGASAEAPLTETSMTNPKCSYGILKLSVEKYLSMYSELYGVTTISLRISNPFGSGQDSQRPQGAVGVFLKKILLDEPITIWGDGSIVRDYIFIPDVITAFISAITYSGTYNVFNIGSGTGTSLIELIQVLEKATGKCAKLCKEDARKFDVQCNILSNALAKENLGWEPQYSLKDGIEITIQHLNSQLLNAKATG